MKLARFLPVQGGVNSLLAGLCLAPLLLGAVGCGNTLYLVEVRRAEKHFQEAQELGAEEHAPYEFYSAKVRLDQAKRQAAIAEYGPASELSDQADEYALQAIEKTKKSRSLARAPRQASAPATTPRATTTQADEGAPEASASPSGSSGQPDDTEPSSTAPEGAQPQ